MLENVSRKRLLIAGLVSAILFPLAVALQAPLREGFDLAVHPLSLLSLGGAGWIQIVNFVASGLLLLAFAVGLRRNLTGERGGRWGPRLFGLYGLVLVAAGVFTTDPMYGFPPGAPEGLPEALSWHAIVHQLTFLLAFLGLIAAQLVFARRFWSVGDRGFALYSALTALATPVLIAVSQTRPDVSGYVLFGMNVLVNLWIALLALRLLAEGRDARVRPAV